MPLMRTSFGGFYRELEADAHRDGPFAVGDLLAKELKNALISSLLTRRRELRLTQAALSAKCGVAQTEISRIERGRKSPTIDTYSRLASALGLQWSLRARSTTSRVQRIDGEAESWSRSQTQASPPPPPFGTETTLPLRGRDDDLRPRGRGPVQPGDGARIAELD